MYAISKNIRKYSPTPIVEVTTNAEGKEEEKIVLISTLKKKEGDELSILIVALLNREDLVNQAKKLFEIK